MSYEVYTLRTYLVNIVRLVRRGLMTCNTCLGWAPITEGMEVTIKYQVDLHLKHMCFSRMARMFNTDEKLSYYLHTLACHGGEFMLALGSLGRYMNEGMEHHHKITWLLYDHSPKGGAPGNPYSTKLENGQFDKTKGKTYTHLIHAPTKSVMKRQWRVFFNRHHRSWDSMVLQGANLELPQKGEDIYQCLVRQSHGVKARRKLYTDRRKEKRHAKSAAARRIREGAVGVEEARGIMHRAGLLGRGQRHRLPSRRASTASSAPAPTPTPTPSASSNP